MKKLLFVVTLALIAGVVYSESLPEQAQAKDTNPIGTEIKIEKGDGMMEGLVSEPNEINASTCTLECSVNYIDCVERCFPDDQSCVDYCAAERQACNNNCSGGGTGGGGTGGGGGGTGGGGGGTGGGGGGGIN